jgi:ADP-ribose pyrophosphatase
MKWKTLSTQYISTHKYFTARKDVCQMPNGTEVPAYFVVEYPVSACAVALTIDNKVVMVRQYRHPVAQVLLELPGGLIDAGESAETGIQRELLEETGYSFTNTVHLGRVAGNPGILNNYTEMYILTGGIQTSKQHLDAQEEIEVVLFTIEEVKNLLKTNQIPQALHVSALYYALQYLKL